MPRQISSIIGVVQAMCSSNYSETPHQGGDLDRISRPAPRQSPTRPTRDQKARVAGRGNDVRSWTALVSAQHPRYARPSLVLSTLIDQVSWRRRSAMNPCCRSDTGLDGPTCRLSRQRSAETVEHALLHRLRPGLLQRQPGGLPTVAAIGIPDGVAIAIARGALRRVPTHPTLRQAIEHQRFVPVASGQFV